MKKIGLLISNLGTPSALTHPALRAYLFDFLKDPRVIHLPRWKWYPILALILCIRPFRLKKAYASIWTPSGSPLLKESQALLSALQSALPDIPMALGMRYGEPGLKKALLSLRQQGVEKIVVLPLYPQYSASTTASTFHEVMRLLQPCPALPELCFINGYATHPLYILALKNSILKARGDRPAPDKLILSFHGLPQRYVEQGDPYFQECQATASALREALSLPEESLLISFQSRVGREPWLMPYTDTLLSELPKKGVKRIEVLCPGFACDCLETLEEVNLRYRALFLEQGGEAFDYIPCLNYSEGHVALLRMLCEEK